MSELDDKMWKAKVAAWLHDPPEKALVLLRGKGHERGTVQTLLRHVFGTDSVPDDVADAVRAADRWAAAADRPERPREGRFVWDRVTFAKNAVLRHPLSGEQYDLDNLEEILPEHAEAIATDHYRKLVGQDGSGDLQTTFLRLWRYAPHAPSEKLDKIWQLLPADSRVPDHSIWEHLGLASAFAGVFAREDVPALLSVTLGPVQAFIEQSRSTSDLWAGSHLLSTLSWQAMKVVCETCGPDSIVMPSLRGVPCVDLWLELERGVTPPQGSESPPWKNRASDQNPLFSATLPNRFLAIVPASKVEALASAIENSVRKWAEEYALRAWQTVCDKAKTHSTDHARQQLKAQLEGFPELHCVAVPWTLAPAGGEKGVQEEPLRKALAPFYPADASAAPGFLGSPLWKLVTGDGSKETGTFWHANPGMLYPAIYDLAVRVSAAAKTTRPFSQLEQRGYRCALCGEREPLVNDEAHLTSRPAKGRGDEEASGPRDVWAALAAKHPGLARPGERLCGVCTLKRMWPSLFVEELKNRGVLDDVHRYVVSTHTMALVPTLEALVSQGDALEAKLENFADSHDDRVALPPRLVRSRKVEIPHSVRRLPAVLDRLGEADERGHDQLLAHVKKLNGDVMPEAYYALVLMDGDRLGAWLSSSPSEPSVGRPRYADLWHPEVAGAVQREFPALQPYLDHRAPPSPAYHGALSAVLNDLSLHVIPTIVEQAFAGKILYAGGDDLLAMIPVRDLLPMMLALRSVFSGQAPKEEAFLDELAQRLDGRTLAMNRGHVLFGHRLYRTMGENATCSMGAVVAHHMAPLGAVLRDLRAAERRAKSSGRDAFSITLAKRAGGTTSFTARWEMAEESSTMLVMRRLVDALRDDLSRRAAYHLIEWMEGAPPKPPPGMVKNMLGYQFDRQRARRADDHAKCRLGQLATAIEAIVRRWSEGEGAEPPPIVRLQDLLRHAEFLAREQRGQKAAGAAAESETAQLGGIP